MTGPTQDVFCLILFLISHSHVWLGTFRQLKIDNVGRKKMGRISKSHLFGGGNHFQYSVFCFLFFKSILVDGLLAHGKKIAGSTPLCVVYTWGQLEILEIEHGCQAAKVLELCLHVTLCGQLDCINASPIQPLECRRHVDCLQCLQVFQESNDDVELSKYPKSRFAEKSDSKQSIEAVVYTLWPSTRKLR